MEAFGVVVMMNPVSTGRGPDGGDSVVGFDALWFGVGAAGGDLMMGFDTPSPDVSRIRGDISSSLDLVLSDAGWGEGGDAVGVDAQSSTVEVQGCKSLLGNDPNGSTRSSIATSRRRTSCLDGRKTRIRSTAVNSRRLVVMKNSRSKRSAMQSSMTSSCGDANG